MVIKGDTRSLDYSSYVYIYIYTYAYVDVCDFAVLNWTYNPFPQI